MKTIGSVLVRGHKVIFFENDVGEVDFRISEPVPDEMFHDIVCYLIDEGLFEEFCDKAEIEEILQSAQREAEED